MLGAWHFEHIQRVRRLRPVDPGGGLALTAVSVFVDEGVGGVGSRWRRRGGELRFCSGNGARGLGSWGSGRS